ncbi:Specific transcriptional repressor [Mycena sanguinolenta]|uniref:Specific transcriptional repressor n=1 Tax=Mycena sanguinolenta TaxID=230812 RepID=A0A8H6YLW4_9AGAR|nr:Specific transcriptional repressor [Mycena sanguinolenta]
MLPIAEIETSYTCCLRVNLSLDGLARARLARSVARAAARSPSPTRGPLMLTPLASSASAYSALSPAHAHAKPHLRPPPGGQMLALSLHLSAHAPQPKLRHATRAVCPSPPRLADGRDLPAACTSRCRARGRLARRSSPVSVVHLLFLGVPEPQAQREEVWMDEIDDQRVVFGVDVGAGLSFDPQKCSACTRARFNMLRALMQRANAFHGSCGQNGANNGTGIAYKVIRDVEKEVVLLELTPGANAAAPSADPIAAWGDTLTVVKMTEVKAPCAQDNPVIVAERRVGGLRADILALAH